MAGFKQGDIVQLKSGGPKMTVIKVVGDSTEEIDTLLMASGSRKGDVQCQWFDKKEQLKSQVFRAEALNVVK